MSKTAVPAGAGQVPAQPTHSQIPSAAVGFKARRRRPGMYALAIALIAAGGGGGFLAFQATGERTPVLAVAKGVEAGDVIKDSDLIEAHVQLDPALKPVLAAEREKVVGKRASVALTPGALLTQGQVTTRTLVKPGERLVGIGLKTSQMPASRLSPGDKILVVSTPANGQIAGETTGEDAAPQQIAARVVRVGERQQTTGEQVVDVAVPSQFGPALAAQAATGNVALVIDGPGES
ncbi:SAF domain-containing protein [Streptomyces sp. NBC_00233]|uniref:SAF domain-containing protein n=1 Tax=Streptomyces sp. NBC_00233 TaxID=2975686 RepID=UPI002256A17A|nr:SAF domain-containing protein [Streptomyces sp. NBC_00233]MCX5231486.1 SAF domain-containing protein [Streptomyces sp. NBC_00233]MCX5233160.1 SAF domain-containing protein [Streptomyces sp. NBC_00233]MCX5233601.1 SAF domain-containing protein [Streptomyces sp. NBC_00233]